MLSCHVWPIGICTWSLQNEIPELESVMNESVTIIPFADLLLIFIPAAAIIGILHTWSLNWHNTIYAVGRMLIQLLLIGYFLNYIFESNNASITISILALMGYIAGAFGADK